MGITPNKSYEVDCPDILAYPVRNVKKIFYYRLNQEKRGDWPRLMLLFPEYKQLAAHIIHNDYHHLGNELPDIAVAAQSIHRDQKNDSFQHAGGNAGCNKLGKLRNDGFSGPVMALEYKGFVGQKRKGYRYNPGNTVTDGSADAQKIQFSCILWIFRLIIPLFFSFRNLLFPVTKGLRKFMYTF